MSKFIVDHDLHMHSQISNCSKDPEQTTENLLKYAEKNGLNTICLTDHYYDPNAGSDFVWHHTQTFENVTKSLPLPQKEGIKFMFGCETDLDMNYVFGVTEDKLDKFEFILASTTHMHINGYTVRGDESPAERAILWIKRLEHVLNMDLPFYKIGISHLTTTKICPSDPIKAFSLIPDSEYHRIFALAQKRGVGIELNFDSLNMKEEEKDILLKPYRIAKQNGCKFYLGSDSHHPQHFVNAKKNFENIVEILELTEEDKFKIKADKK